MTVKLVVIYPRPNDIEAFETVYNRDHVPTATTTVIATRLFKSVQQLRTIFGSSPVRPHTQGNNNESILGIVAGLNRVVPVIEQLNHRTHQACQQDNRYHDLCAIRSHYSYHTAHGACRGRSGHLCSWPASARSMAE